MKERQQRVFSGQRNLRGRWRRYLDGLAPHRAQLHAYCCRLTGNVWDGEDLMQDTLLRVFGVVGRTDSAITNPRTYLLRTATNLWIDRVRRAARERATLALEEEHAVADTPEPGRLLDGRVAAERLFRSLSPQERAAVVLKDVFDLSLQETAFLLTTSVGAVKDALSRGRARLDARKPAAAGIDAPPPELVERFLQALRARDLDAVRSMCADGVTVELVGGAELDDFDEIGRFLRNAHFVMPRFGLGQNPRWETAVYLGETLILGFRTLGGVEGLNEVHRVETLDGKLTRVRTYCFCPETLAVVAAELGHRALARPFRNPALRDVLAMLLGLRKLPPQPAARPASRAGAGHDEPHH